MKHAGLIIIAIILVVGLAGAAYLAGQMLATDNEAGNSGGGGNIEMVAHEGDGGAAQFNLDIEPASELPDRLADNGGLFLRRQDNSLFIGTGDIEVSVDIDSSGQPKVSSEHNGPELEVVVGRETIIYQDQTEFEPESGEQSGTKKIQQIVKQVESLGELTENTEIQVWGEQRGDRVVAEVLVYRAPFAWNIE